MKKCIYIPPTPESYHQKFEATLATIRKDTRRPHRLLSPGRGIAAVLVLAAAIAGWGLGNHVLHTPVDTVVSRGPADSLPPTATAGGRGTLAHLTSPATQPSETPEVQTPAALFTAMPTQPNTDEQNAATQAADMETANLPDPTEIIFIDDNVVFSDAVPAVELADDIMIVDSAAAAEDNMTTGPYPFAEATDVNGSSANQTYVALLESLSAEIEKNLPGWTFRDVGWNNEKTTLTEMDDTDSSDTVFESSLGEIILPSITREANGGDVCYTLTLLPDPSSTANFATDTAEMSSEYFLDDVVMKLIGQTLPAGYHVAYYILESGNSISCVIGNLEQIAREPELATRVADMAILGYQQACLQNDLPWMGLAVDSLNFYRPLTEDEQQRLADADDPFALRAEILSESIAAIQQTLPDAEITDGFIEFPEDDLPPQ